MLKRRLPKKIWIPLAIVITLCGLAIYYDRYIYPRQITSSVRSRAVHGEFFTEAKLVSTKDEGPISLNGDGTERTIFQLSKTEIETILASESMLKCHPGEECTLDRDGNCSSADVPSVIIFTLCVDPSNNQAEWTRFWY